MKIFLLEVEYAGWKIKVEGNTTGQVPALAVAKTRAQSLALSMKEEGYEIHYLDGRIEEVLI